MKTTPAKLFTISLGIMAGFAAVAIPGGSVQADPPGYGYPGRGRPSIPHPGQPGFPGGPRRPVPPGPGHRPEPGRPVEPGRPMPPHPGTGGPRRPLPIGRPIYVRGPMSGHEDEVRAIRILQAATRENRCERIGESLRRISNAILSSASEANSRDDHLLPRDARGLARLQMRESWRRTLRSRVFWETVFDRLMEAYRSCDASCIEDGEAIGVLAGTMYCAANLGVGGLEAPGFLAQNSLPVCETSVFVGCQTGYRQAAQTYEGCTAYTSGSFERTFLESISQDCHVEGT
jgi:hypothetical protein